MPALYGEMAAIGDPIDVILMAGQSNCLGRAELASKECSANSNTWLYEEYVPDGGDNDVWGGVEDINGTYYGPELGVASDVTPIAFIRHAVDGTGLEEHWLPALHTYYDDFTTTVDNGLAHLDACGLKYHIVAFLWVQGERDALTEAYANNYQANLTTLVAQVRADYGAGIPVIVVEIGCSYTYADTVRAKEAAFVAADGNAALIDTDGLGMDDGVHFNEAAQCTIGERVAAEL